MDQHLVHHVGVHLLSPSAAVGCPRPVVALALADDELDVGLTLASTMGLGGQQAVFLLLPHQPLHRLQSGLALDGRLVDSPRRQAEVAVWTVLERGSDVLESDDLLRPSVGVLHLGSALQVLGHWSSRGGNALLDG